MTIKRTTTILSLFTLHLLLVSCTGNTKVSTPTGDELKLYWFIPDGLRAEPELFNIFEWAEEGELPNIKRMMDNGAYGYSIPVYPGHTPTNFATLLTGSTPKVHGVADGPMRIEGYPLEMVAVGGFSSVAKKVPPIWYTLEDEGLNVALISIPGSTPPELETGITIRGRWGGWGADFPAVNFHSSADDQLKILQGLGNRIFYFGPRLTVFSDPTAPMGWEIDLAQSFSPAREAEFTNWGSTVYGYIYDSSDDGMENYDRVLFSKDKRSTFADLGEGQWSDWLPITLYWETTNDYNIYTPKRMDWELALSRIAVKTDVKIRIIKLGEKDFFRIRFFYNNLNEHLTKPSYVSDEILNETGPMVDFVDNYPPQLIFFPEDKDTFIEEADFSLEWHRDVVDPLIGLYNPEVVIHDTYTPNQMLTSRWWLGYVDPESPRYDSVTEEEREQLWGEIKDMYKQIDDILGEILENADDNTIIVLSSDHGAVPLHTWVRLNNLFAREGLLSFEYDNETGEHSIDWKNSQVVFLKMDDIYINPEGLDGNWKRASGLEYEQLRERAIDLLLSLEAENGEKPVGEVHKWEDAEFIDLPKDRVGDLIIANRPGYGWEEGVTADLEVFHESLKSGYKQAVIPDDEPGMWTPFVIVGPGVKKGYEIKEPIRHIDQYPSLMELLGIESPDFVEGQPIEEIFID